MGVEWHVVFMGLLFAVIGWYLFHDPILGGLIGLALVIYGSRK
jgi:hypothetical protein